MFGELAMHQGRKEWEHCFEAFFSGPTEAIHIVTGCEDGEVPRRTGLQPSPGALSLRIMPSCVFLWILKRSLSLRSWLLGSREQGGPTVCVTTCTRVALETWTEQA